MWRSFLDPVDEYHEKKLQTLLGPDCFGTLVAGQRSSFVSLEKAADCHNILLRFVGDVTGSQPDVAVWNMLPVLAKPGRLAAQFYVMLQLDTTLKKFKEVQTALSDGFIRAYAQEAPHFQGTGPNMLRLHLHIVLCILEYHHCTYRRERKECDESLGAIKEFFREQVLFAEAALRSVVDRTC
jgi:hypothetical protein